MLDESEGPRENESGCAVLNVSSALDPEAPWREVLWMWLSAWCGLAVT